MPSPSHTLANIGAAIGLSPALTSELIECASREFAVAEGWIWDDLGDDENTSHGWSQSRIRRRVYGNLATVAAAILEERDRQRGYTPAKSAAGESDADKWPKFPGESLGYTGRKDDEDFHTGGPR